MNTIKCFTFLFFVAVASGGALDSRSRVSDPWGPARETCRQECGLTREELAEAGNDLSQLTNYVGCLGRILGNLNKDGTANRENILVTIAPMVPLLIAEPIVECCLTEVYLGKHPHAHDVDALFTDFVNCWKNLLPSSIWNLIGMTRPPAYALLNKCQRGHW